MVSPNPATLHQSLQPQLKLDAPFVDASGRMTPPWNRLLLYLWQQVGAGNIPQASSLQLSFANSPNVDIVNNQGQIIGSVQVENTPGTPEEILNVGTSNVFVYTATVSGTLVVNMGRLELSRSGPFYVVGVMGGAVRLLPNDKARISWAGSPAEAIWFPDN